MSECNLNNLSGGSRSTIAIAIVFIAIVAGAGGGILGWITGTSTPERPGTTLVVDVASDFSVTFNSSGVILHPANASYNCSSLFFLSINTEVNDFDQLVSYMNDNPDYYFGHENVTDVLGGENFQTGMRTDVITNSMYNMGPVRNDAKLDGERFLIDYGNNVVMIFFMVGIFINGTFEEFSFGFESNVDFIVAMNDGLMNSTVMNDAVFIRGLGNSIVINGLNIDLDDIMNSFVDVTFNDVSMSLPFGYVL